MKKLFVVAFTAALLFTARMTSADSLAGNRNRLFEDYITRLNPYISAQDKCWVWRTLSLEQQGAFFTITHRLSISHLYDGGSVLDHVAHLYAIRGDTDSDTCGGGDDNRLFMGMDSTLRTAFTYSAVYDNLYGNASWGPSGDIFGPHSPFTDSRETTIGYPRGQVHFFASFRYTDGWVCRPSLGILGGCYNDPNMLEMDQDYDWNHPSSTECTYDNPWVGYNQRGRYMYETNYGPSHGYGPLEFGWEPAACSAPPPPPPPPGVYQGCYTDDSIRALPQFLGNVNDIDTCVNLGRGANLPYVGLQWYGECWGGYEVRYSRVSDAECNTPCPSGQMCGGGWRNSIYATGVAPQPPPTGGMERDAAVRGCANYVEWPPVFKADAASCYSYCQQNGANACEWNVNGDCYVEFGSGCYLVGGFSGWWSAVFP